MYTNKKSKHIKFHTDIEVSLAVMLSVNLRWRLLKMSMAPSFLLTGGKTEKMIRCLGFYFILLFSLGIDYGMEDFFPLKQLKMMLFNVFNMVSARFMK